MAMRMTVLSCVVLVCFSCTQSLERDEYIKWVSDYQNGLHVRKASSPFIFDIQFEPAEYVAMRNQSATPDANDLQYYVMRISMENPQDNLITHSINTVADKQQRLYYFSFLFQNDLFLEENGEELPCVFFHYEQSGLTSSNTFLLGFEHPKKGDGEECKLVLKSEKFGSLPIKIKVSKQNIPTVRI